MSSHNEGEHSMTQIPANPSRSPFDAIRHEDEHGE